MMTLLGIGIFEDDTLGKVYIWYWGKDALVAESEGEMKAKRIGVQYKSVDEMVYKRSGLLFKVKWFFHRLLNRKVSEE